MRAPKRLCLALWVVFVVYWLFNASNTAQSALNGLHIIVSPVLDAL